MVPYPADMAAELRGSIAELEQQLQSSTAENARLQHELTLARERQSASAEILRAIANAGGNADASLQQVAETTASLFGASSVSLLIADGERWGRTLRVGAGSERIAAAIPLAHVAITPRFMPGAVYLENRQVHVPDCDDPAAMARWPGLAPARTAGTRTISGTPLRREGRAIGALIIHRGRLEPFTVEELTLQQSFADQAVIAIENARLFNDSKTKSRELGEALQQQTATADVLQIISNSPGELEPVFRAVLENATRICDAQFGTLLRFDGKAFYFAADVGTPEPLREHVRRPGPFQGLPGGMIDRILRTCELQHSPDYAAEPAPGLAARLGGARSTLGVPILRDDALVGAIVIYRQEVRPFSSREIDLVRGFATQAAIAIENASLFNETRDALARQTATSDILRVISQSPTDAQPVFEAIAQTAVRLLGCDRAFIQRCDDKSFWTVAWCGPDGQLPILNTSPVPIDPNANFPSRAIVERTTLHLPDWSAVELPPFERAIQERLGIASALYMPLLRNGECIGLLAMAGKLTHIFDKREITLAEAFRDQALIAIENTRLFNEVQAKTKDLTEVLQQQTATADVLKVISRSAFDLDSVMNTLTHSAAELCKAELNALYIREGDVLVARGVADADPAQADFLRRTPLQADNSTYIGRTLLAGAIRNIADVDEEREIGSLKRFSEALDFRSILFVPLMREGRGIGVFALARKRKGQFSQREVELVQTFADQAVIAIENARLFDEVQAKTLDLTEALERQTATTEVLSVISRSPSDLRPVLEAISETAARLCGSEQTMFFRFDGEVFRILASWNFPPDVHEMLERRPLRPGHPSAVGRAGASLKPVCIPDVLADPHYGLTSEQNRAHYRTTLAVPLMREDRLIGAFSLNRSEPNSFTEKHIELVAMFADQAVIAIENTRLFDEVQAKTRELSEALTYQTGSANILRVIASSPTDVEPTLKAIVESACELCGAYDAGVLLKDGEFLRFSAHHGSIPIGLERWPINRRWAAGRAFIDQAPVHIEDISDESHSDLSDGRELAIRMGHRSILSVPLLHESESIGAIVLRRKEMHPFTEKQITLLQTSPTRRSSQSATSACSRRCKPAPGSSLRRSTSCAPPRIDWCRPRSSPRSASSPPVSHTRSRTRSTSSTILRHFRPS